VTAPDLPPGDPSGEEPVRPMIPLDRRRLRLGHPPQAIPLHAGDHDDWGDDESGEELPRSTRQDLDPVFGYILAMALSVGLTPLQANTRYVLLWAFLGVMGGMAFLLGSGIQFRVSDPGDLLWGIGLGIFTGGALILVGYDTLEATAERLFGASEGDSDLLATWIFQATVFVMPLTETLFFRGAMQRAHPIPVVALLASFWSVLMFFPNLGLGETPVVGMVFGTTLVLLNFLYSYVHYRHGLAASFLCQVSAGTLLLLVPSLITF
jgi:hypothetical protein